MRSPFGIFRKHGTILTAILVVLSIFAFTLADFLRPEHLLPMLGILGFSLIFYLLAQPSGKGGWAAAVGAILGFVIVSFLPTAFGPPAAATTSVGDLSQEELREQMLKRRNANQFMLQVYIQGNGNRPEIPQLPPSIMNNPQFRGQIIQMFRQQQMWDAGFRTFGFAPLQESDQFAREDTVRTWVMAQQADEIGVHVSNAAISEYLKKASNGRLSAEQFTRYRQELTMSEAELYDLLRFQIKAKLYQQLTFPSVMTPPEQMWDFYTRATVKQDMELVSVPVDAFTGQYFPYTIAAEIEYYTDPQSSVESAGTLASGTEADLVLDQETEQPVSVTVDETQYLQIRSGDVTGAYVESGAVAVKSEVLDYFEAHKNRYPQGRITEQEGWTVPVAAMSPEPAFGVPRRIQLAYLKATIPDREDYDPSEAELRTFYEQNIENYSDPSFSRPLEDPEEPEDPNKPAVAQRLYREGAEPAAAEKPAGYDGPAWAEKREYLDFYAAQEDVREDWIFDRQQKARLENDERISQLMVKMNELSLASQIEGEGHMTPQEISDALAEYALELGFDKDDYVVTEPMTPKEMTATQIGQAVEVDINPNPAPGQRKATVKTGGANVVYQMFEESPPDELFRPQQVIAPDLADTRYAYWKIDDLEPYVPERESLSRNQQAEVSEAWKIFKARDQAKDRAEEIRGRLAKYFANLKDDAEDRDFTKALDELELKTVVGDRPLNVVYPTGFSWMQTGGPQGGPELGRVNGVEKAGERFMQTAFHKLDYDEEKKESELGVLANADSTVFYVGKAIDRRYGEADSIEVLLQSYVDNPDQSAMQVVNMLRRQQSQELVQKWRQQFDERFQIQITPPEQAEPLGPPRRPGRR